MSAYKDHTTVIRMDSAIIPLALTTAVVNMVTMVTDTTAQTSMNALHRLTGVIQMQAA